MKYLAYTLCIIALAVSCTRPAFRQRYTRAVAPNVFKARFETTKGNFEIEAHREWSPRAVDRLYQLIRSGFYNNTALYRVIPDFVVQFGTANDSMLNSSWARYTIADEPVLHSNDSGTVAFARSGKDSRSSDIYINLRNNHRLDTLQYNGVTGFPVIALVTAGMGVVQQFYNGYQEAPMGNAGEGIAEWNTYFKNKYPRLDYISKAYLVR